MDCEDAKMLRLCASYAAIAHKDQFRKDRRTPFIVHPGNVALLAATQPVIVEVPCAGWLHDIIEDCQDEKSKKENAILNQPKTLHEFLMRNLEINPLRGKIIFELVHYMTQDKNKPKKQRRLMNYKQLTGEEVPIEACLLRACDRIDNLNSYHLFGAKKRAEYINDTKLMIDYIGTILHDGYLPIYELLWKSITELGNI